jgi:iron(III)-salmochelin esterase
MSDKLGRRRILGFGALALPLSTGALRAAIDAGSDRFELSDWKLEGSADLSRRAVVLVPRDVPEGTRIPSLVLLHGLGETSDETLGVRAWIDRYGLLSSLARLSRPPITPESKRGDLTSEHAREISDALRAKPFDGRLVLVCPFTPNVWRLPQAGNALDRLAAWVTDVLLPTVRAKTPADPSPHRTGIDGCSLGGFVALEVFLRKPSSFGAWGGVQAALREASASRWADRIGAALKTAGPRRFHIETSRGDPFFAANAALSRELERRAIRHDFAVLPGPHDQPWLREVGTLEMLLWHDRALRVDR